MSGWVPVLAVVVPLVTALLAGVWTYDPYRRLSRVLSIYKDLPEPYKTAWLIEVKDAYETAGASRLVPSIWMAYSIANSIAVIALAETGQVSAPVIWVSLLILLVNFVLAAWQYSRAPNRVLPRRLDALEMAREMFRNPTSDD